MNLSRHGREYYRISITTSPATAATDWEASFDGGTTWVTATDIEGDAAWLVEGDLAPGSEVGAVLTSSMTPLVRLQDSPEIVVRDGLQIRLTV